MYKIFSVDDHIIEPADVWSSRVPARHRATAPHVVEEDGRQYWVYEDQRLMTMGLNAVAGKRRHEWSTEPARFSDMAPGCYDPKERAKEMLAQGVLASVCFPTLPRFGGMLFNSFKDKDLADVCVQVYNDFILDEWCPSGPDGLFVPMIIAQVWDPVRAAAEIRRCAALGARALAFVENPVPDGLPGFHDSHWDPLWRAAEETDMAVCMHIGSSGFMAIPDPSCSFSGLITLGNVPGMMAMVNLLVSPVCHKFPAIKVVFSEAGIGWIPSVLERADRQVDRHRYWSGVAGELKPSEIFARNMYACMIEEPIGLTLHELIGVDRILSETDYPHCDSPYPHTQTAYDEVFRGLPAHVVEAVSHGNAERVFNWCMADDALLHVPEITDWRAELEADPYAAHRYRHEISGIKQIDEAGPARCSARVFGATSLTECGELLDAAGHCPAGHDSFAATRN